MTTTTERHHADADARTQLGALLGTEGPVSEDALRAAVENDSYARYLMAARGAPAVLQALLAAPPTRRAAPASLSGAELLRSAARALGRWAATGFQRVDDETYARRIAACGACDRLADPPKRALYHLVPVVDNDGRICSVCGCVATTKARVPTESCPLAHPEQPHLTRWGEPRRGT